MLDTTECRQKLSLVANKASVVVEDLLQLVLVELIHGLQQVVPVLVERTFLPVGTQQTIRSLKLRALPQLTNLGKVLETGVLSNSAEPEVNKGIGILCNRCRTVPSQSDNVGVLTRHPSRPSDRTNRPIRTDIQRLSVHHLDAFHHDLGISTDLCGLLPKVFG